MERLEAERVEAARRESERQSAARRPAQPERDWEEDAVELSGEIDKISKDARPRTKPVAVEKPSKKKTTRPAKPKPEQDEWGLYDPAQCGFDALFAKIEQTRKEDEERELEEEDEGEKPRPSMRARASSTTPAAVRSSRTVSTPRERPGLAPLAMWAHAEMDPFFGDAAKGWSDDLRGLMGQLQLPTAVAAVGYATGCHIRRVRVAPRERPKRKMKSDEPVVILSRRRLRELRQKNGDTF
jgi:hypothetical protein